MLVPVYENTRRHMPEYSSLHEEKYQGDDREGRKGSYHIVSYRCSVGPNGGALILMLLVLPALRLITHTAADP